MTADRSNVRNAPVSWSVRKRLAACVRKVRHATWEDARIEGLRVSRENPKGVNPPTPYPCSEIGEPHYHCGHLIAVTKGARWRANLKARKVAA